MSVFLFSLCVVFSCLNCLFSNVNFLLSRLTFDFTFCALLLLTTNYCDIYKSITACTFVAAFNKLYCIVLYCIMPPLQHRLRRHYKGD